MAMLASTYLFAYNSAMFAAWLYVLCNLAASLSSSFTSTTFEAQHPLLIPQDYLATEPKGSASRPVVPPVTWQKVSDLSFYAKTTYVKPRLIVAYRSIESLAITIQTATILETIHAILRVVRSSPANNFLQWIGRTHVIAVAAKLATYVPETKQYTSAEQMPSFHALTALAVVFFWALSECIRYPWAAVKIVADSEFARNIGAIQSLNRVLTWLRYSAFVVLYPAGFLAEEALLIGCLPFAFSRKPYDIAMPNAWNFSFTYSSFLLCVLYAQPVGFFALYIHMFEQRYKKLGGVPSSSGTGDAAAAKQKKRA